MVGNINGVQQVVEVSFGLLESISLLSSIASLVISILAIWLSIKFYQMSTASSKEIKESSSNVNNNVKKLEKIFDTMYRDTIGMVKDTVTHMRRQEVRNSQGNESSRELDSRIKGAISEQLNDVSAESLTNEDVKDLVLNLVKESKEIEQEMKKGTLEKRVLNILARDGERTFGNLITKLLGPNSTNDEVGVLFDTILSMAERGVVENHFRDEEEGKSLSHSAPIRLTNRES